MSRFHSPNGSQSSTILPLTYVVDACERFEIEWRGGIRPRIETYLEGVEPGQRERLLRELLAIEVELRIAHGENPTARAVPLAVSRLGPRDHGRLREGPLGGARRRGRARCGRRRAER